MTTLAADSARVFEIADINEFPVIAADIIYEGAAVGDNGSGYARPLVSADPFRGFAERKADNSAGAAGAINVRVISKGKIRLSISGLAITDVGKPVWATDDNAFVITGGVGTLVGHVYRYVSSGVGIVAFDASQAEEEVLLALPITLANVTAADVLTTFTPGFAGRIKSLNFAVTTAVSTGSKAAPLNAEIGTINLTGGTVALTSANCTPLGAIIAGAAITAGAAFGAADTISIEAASVTAFVEGAGVLYVRLGK